ncbi:MAG: transposase [Candidatus Korobacteraceae bacterium]
MVFLDESGASTQMTRNYGRAPSGKRVPEGTPQSHWHTVTMLAALTTKGLQAPMTIESPTDGDVFLAYLEQVLCPQLHHPILPTSTRLSRLGRRSNSGCVLPRPEPQKLWKAPSQKPCALLPPTTL